MATEAARDFASRVGLDLVEVAPNAQPPVCKIMDYGRYKYELKKKASTAKKSQHRTQIKEIKLRPRIEEHDLAFKLRRARQFLMDGDKVRCTVWFRGREIVHQEIGRKVLVRVAERLGDIAKVEQQARLENRQLGLTLAPDRSAIDKILRMEKKTKDEQLAQEAQEGQEVSAPEEAAGEQEAGTPEEEQGAKA
jgi:translation initiation factor IF-3